MGASQVLLVAVATLLIGTADAFGGQAARRAPPITVAMWSQALGIPILIGVAVGVGGAFILRDLMLGTVAGIGSSIGVMALYRGFSVAPVGIVAPVASTVAAVLPIGVGLIEGERPSAVVGAGIVVALVAIVLVSYVPAGGDHTRGALVHGVVAGVGFGGVVIAYAATTPASGLWSAVSGRVSATLVALIAVLVLGTGLRIVRTAWAGTITSGVLASSGMAAFVAVSQTTELLILGVALGMFPTVTAVVAAVVLKDRLRVSQWMGIGLATIAVTLISIG